MGPGLHHTVRGAVSAGTFLFLLVLTGCPGAPAADAPTWQNDIRPLFARSCAGCHQEGGIAPFALTRYDDVAAFGPIVRQSVTERSMPPWGHDEDCRPALGTMWLSDEEVALVERWADADFPAGADDPDQARPPEVEALERRSPDLTLTFSEPYTLDPARRDDYRCILLDQTFETDTFVTLTDFFPDNTPVVHHVIVYVVADAQVPIIEALDEAEPGIGYTCFGDSGVAEANWLAGWAPGAGQGFPSSDTAIRVPQGSRLIMQMHYNVVSPTEDVLTDQTEIGLWTLPPGETPDYLVTTLPVVNYGIDIDQGDAQSVHTSTHRLPLDTTIVGAGPHMHLLGQALRMDLIRQDGSRECLVDVPHWDFAWQRGYVYALDKQLTADRTDRFEMRCVYDNSAENQPFVDGTLAAPRRVSWGEGSLDEMCMNTLILLEPYFPPDGGGLCAGFSHCFSDCPADDPFCPFACMTKSGLGCLQCGSDSIFGPCTRELCPAETVDFGACFYQCPVDDGDPYAAFRCMVERCPGPLEAYYTCVEPILRSGACADDWAACGGMTAP